MDNVYLNFDPSCKWVGEYGAEVSSQSRDPHVNCLSMGRAGWVVTALRVIGVGT